MRRPRPSVSRVVSRCEAQTRARAAPLSHIVAAPALIASAIGMATLGGCLVDVDESLLDARSSDGGAGADVATYEGMVCGSGRCMPPRQVCCAGSYGNADRRAGSCDTPADCKTGDYWECMSPIDCARAGRPVVCCASHFEGSSAFSKALCQASCDATATTLCDPSAPACAPGARCVPSTEFPELHECR